MTKDDTLVAKIAERGYTPGRRDLAKLVLLLGDADEDTRDQAERALARGGVAFAEPLAASLASLGSPSQEVQVRLARLLGKLGSATDAVRAPLVALSASEVERVRREAWRALGKLGGAEKELLAAWERPDLDLSERRALASALGTSGGSEALAALRAHENPDAEVTRRVGKARATVRRTLLRKEDDGKLDPEAELPGPVYVDFFCRAGLEGLLEEEIHEPILLRSEGRVRARVTGTFGSLYRTRLATSFAFPLAPERIRAGEEGPAAAIVRALVRPATLEFFRRAGKGGPLRFRLGFSGGGHKRALVWTIATELERSFPELVNDPRDSPWQVDVLLGEKAVTLSLTPRGLDDPRFAYRVTDVPAASHPTIAAAIARVAGAIPSDVVWDPFAGSGTELVERARLGSVEKLIGTDLSEVAIASARRNLQEAGLAADLSVEDLTQAKPRTVDLVITNPPMGRRVVPDGGLASLLTTFVEVVARSLRAGGRLVWLSPSPSVTGPLAERLGLTKVFSTKVDLGGFFATLERWDRTPPRPEPASVAPRRPRMRR